MIKYKERITTDHIYMVYKDCDKATYKELYTKARLAGDFDTGYHFYVTQSGNIINDRNYNTVAGYDLKDNTVSVYVLIDAPRNILTDNQLKALGVLKTQLCAQFTVADIINITA